MNYDFDLTEEKLLECINQNKLQRISKINNLLKLINILKRNTIISIDGDWGCGKTVFVKQIELINKLYLNNKINLISNQNLNNDIIKEFNDKHFIYYYNAWENDNHIDPLNSIIYKIINDFPREKAQTADGNIQIPLNFKAFMKTISKDLFDIDKVQSYDDLVKNIHTIEEQKKALNVLLDSIIPNGKKIIIIIDELDRCNPNYAVKVIETIKHFFDNKNLIFLVVSNNEQLAHTVSKFYGEKFDGYGYLNKIYDLIISLENVDVNKYLNNVLLIYNDSSYISVMIRELCNYYSFSMRQINRYLYTMDLLNDYFDSYDSFGNDLVLKYIFIPYCLALKINSGEKFNKFISGRDIEEFILVMKSKKEIQSIINRIKENDNVYKDKEIDDENYIRSIYDKYLNKNDTDYNIDTKKQKFLDIISMISNFSSI